MLIFVLGLIALAAVLASWATYYRRSVSAVPELIHQNSKHHHALLQKLPRLFDQYRATPWAFNQHLQLILLIFKEAFEPELQWDEREVLKTEDGGSLSLFWLGQDLPADTPSILLLHTIAGSEQSMARDARALSKLTGWRIVLCLRRGHADEPLTSPRFNTMGDTADLRQKIARVESRFPQSPLYVMGSSAGTALLVRYLGEQGGDTPIRGAFAYCPGFDISRAFKRSQPFYGQYIARKLIKKFVAPNEAMLSSIPSLNSLKQARDLHAFHEYQYECAGYGSFDDYLTASNPVLVMDNIQIPVMILNAADDPVCVIENVRDHEDRIRRLPKAIAVVTQRGSHCAFFEGWAATSWSQQLMAEYFLALASLSHHQTIGNE